MSRKTEFGGIGYQTTRMRDRAAIIEYLLAGGLNDADTVRGFFADHTDEELVHDLFQDWVTEPDEDEMTEAEALEIMRDLKADQSWLNED